MRERLLLFRVLSTAELGARRTMSTPEDCDKRSRLIDQIEVEVIREPQAPFQEDRAPTTYEANPLRALEELVERMEELEEKTGARELSNDELEDESRRSITEMQRHLEQFQRQSAVLKRLLLKLH